MNFPDYIIIGSAKCGTTSLCNYLNAHPSIKMTNPKELDFFGRPNIEDRIESYCKHFEKNENIVSGEGSVSYMLYSELAAAQIKQYVPNVKLIVMLRNPIDRFYSDFWFNINRGAIVYKKGLFENVISNTVEVPYSPIHKMSYRESLISKGMYSTHLKNYLKYFDSDQIKVVFFEDFTKDTKAVLKSIYDFLGVEYSEVEAPEKIYNKTLYPGKLNAVYLAWKKIKPYLPNQFILDHRYKLTSFKDFLFTEKKVEFPPQARKELLAIYSESIKELEDILNKDLSKWKK